MSYTLITPQTISLTGVSQALPTVPAELIFAGNDNFGASQGDFMSAGMHFRNIPSKLILVCQNMHTYLNAYVRLITTKTVETLAVEDAVYTVAPNADPLLISRFTTIFNAEGQAPKVVGQQTIQVTYYDFVRINFSHDAADPTDCIKIGLYHV